MYRHEVLRAPVRTLAAEIGISKSAVDRFYKLRSHPGKNWPKLRDWYMARHAQQPDEYQTPPELIATLMLRTFEEVPSSRRASTLRKIVEEYKAAHAGVPLPKWVQMLDDVAEREAST